MESNTKVISKRKSGMGKADSSGRTAASMSVDGTKASSMATASIAIRMVYGAGVPGTKVKELTGMMKIQARSEIGKAFVGNVKLLIAKSS